MRPDRKSKRRSQKDLCGVPACGLIGKVIQQEKDKIQQMKWWKPWKREATTLPPFAILHRYSADSEKLSAVANQHLLFDSKESRSYWYWMTNQTALAFTS